MARASMTFPWHTKRGRVLLLLGVAVLAAVFLPVPAQRSVSAPAVASSNGAVTTTKSVSRIHLEDGKNVVADQRAVTLHVDQTKQLHDRQVVNVTWSGAHPSGFRRPDPNAPDAATQEYPMVLLECRGLDSPNAAPANRLSPQTCWTQTPNERFFSSSTLLFPPWRVDRYASAADRKKVVGAPRPLPSGCFSTGGPEYWLHFIAANGAVYKEGPQDGCAGIAPEQSAVGATQGLPSNTTYGFTNSDGTGQAKFDVWTSLTNTSLGCSPAVPCSLVAVPVEGISCDVAAAGLPSIERPKGQNATDAEDACTTDGGKDQPSLSVTGFLWWSASNWRNRITIPLDFAPLPVTQCSGSGKPGVDIYGSELMTAATLQWSSKFCTDPSLFPMTHVQTGEPQARNLLITGNADAAFTSSSPDGGWGSPIVSAPVAMTGFGIGYDIDDKHGHEYTQLRLTPRLLAKLLTESYPAITAIKNGYPALANNPINITQDPEFQALNPDVAPSDSGNFGASTMLMLSSDSDVVHALTAYINADPEARAWLDGQPDPWGMVVNPNYRGMQLPVDNWPLLDSYEPLDAYDNGTNVCLQDNPVPYLPLVASPMLRLSLISLNLQYSIQQSQVVCQGAAGSDPKLVATGRQQIGFRFMIGITSLADARRYGISTAALQTQVASSAPGKFTDATGRSFVAPTDAGLRAAAAELEPDAARGTWRMPYDKLVGPDGSTSAYPGAMLVNAAIPTKALPPAEARDYAGFLRFVAGPGQSPGGGNGQLPAGYLPLTSANGLGAQQHYTEVAAQYVATQNSKVPSLTNPQPVPQPSATEGTSSTPSTSSSVRPTPGVGDGANPPPVAPGGSTTPSGEESTSTPSAAGSTTPVANSSSSPVATAPTPSLRAPLIGTILPILALVALAAGFTAPALTRFAGRRRP